MASIKSEKDAVILSYHDTLLRRTDMKLLEGPYWLNDKIIGFSFQYFENERFKNKCQDVTFISPDVTQFIKLGSHAELELFLQPLDLHTKRLVFLAVNDSSDTSQAGGSHWSLLVFSRDEGMVSHYDSNHGYNEAAARSITKKIYPYLRAHGEVEYKETLTPQQKNCHDCGLYAIAVAEALCMRYLEGSKVNLDDHITPGYVSKKRQDLQELIVHLAKGR